MRIKNDKIFKIVPVKSTITGQKPLRMDERVGRHHKIRQNAFFTGGMTRSIPAPCFPGFWPLRIDGRRVGSTTQLRSCVSIRSFWVRY